MARPDGDVSVYCGVKEIKVTGAADIRTLRFKSKAKPVCKQGDVRASVNAGLYEVIVEKGKRYVVSYKG